MISPVDDIARPTEGLRVDYDPSFHTGESPIRPLDLRANDGRRLVQSSH